MLVMGNGLNALSHLFNLYFRTIAHPAIVSKISRKAPVLNGVWFKSGSKTHVLENERDSIAQSLTSPAQRNRASIP